MQKYTGNCIRSGVQNMNGGLAQSVECVVRNDEAAGSKPAFSTLIHFFLIFFSTAVHHFVGFEPGFQKKR